MLTVKLQNKSTGRTKIVECETAEVVPCGEDVVIEAATVGVKQSFVVSPEAAPDDSFTIAYIENSSGVTTQIVRAPWRNAAAVRQTHR